MTDMCTLRIYDIFEYMNGICDSHVQWRCIPGHVHHVFKLLQENSVEDNQSSQLVENPA